MKNKPLCNTLDPVYGHPCRLKNGHFDLHEARLPDDTIRRWPNPKPEDTTKPSKVSDMFPNGRGQTEPGKPAVPTVVPRAVSLGKGAVIGFDGSKSDDYLMVISTDAWDRTGFDNIVTTYGGEIQEIIVKKLNEAVKKWKGVPAFGIKAEPVADIGIQSMIERASHREATPLYSSSTADKLDSETSEQIAKSIKDEYDKLTKEEASSATYWLNDEVTVTEEIRSVDPVTGAEKGVKPARYDLIPTAFLDALARHYGQGATKYAPRNWEAGYDWSKSYAAIQRHLNAFWSGQDIDPDPAMNGASHLIAAAWHIIALFEFSTTHPEKDDRVKYKDEAS